VGAGLEGRQEVGGEPLSETERVELARLLEVSRSGFYASCKRAPSPRAIREERIEAKIGWFHGESDEVSRPPRILADLREDGEAISRKTVTKTMRKLGLRGICPKKWRTTTITDPADTYPVDAAKRQRDTGALNAVWDGDITYSAQSVVMCSLAG
jgi:hypothetical protein